MLNISKEKLRKLEIPLPPMELQNTFARFVDKTNVLVERQSMAVERLDLLFNTLQARAFNGDLIPDAQQEVGERVGA